MYLFNYIESQEAQGVACLIVWSIYCAISNLDGIDPTDRSIGIFIHFHSTSICVTGVLSFVAVSLLIATAFCYFPTMAKVETKFSVQDATAVASGISKFSSALFQVLK